MLLDAAAVTGAQAGDAAGVRLAVHAGTGLPRRLVRGDLGRRHRRLRDLVVLRGGGGGEGRELRIGLT